MESVSDYLTVKEVADRLGLCSAAARNMLYRSDIKYLTIPNAKRDTIRVDRRSFEEWVKKNTR